MLAFCKRTSSIEDLPFQPDDKKRRIQRVSQTTVEDPSIHSASITEIHEMPIDVIIQPIQSDIDDKKIDSIIMALNDPDEKSFIPPVDIIWIEGTEGGNYFYGFSGVHRIEAHKKIGLTTIRVKLIKSCVTDLKIYLGDSAPKNLR